MYCQRHAVTVTTASDGSATAYTDKAVTGAVLSIQYVKTDFADGVDFAVTAETTGQGLWTESNVNASATRCPRQPTHDAVGAASLYASGGEPVEDYIHVANERIKIIIASGGNAKVGTFYITVG